MMNAVKVVCMGFTLFELACFSQGKAYNKTDVCSSLNANENVKGWARKLSKDARAVTKVKIFEDWSGNKKLGDFCTLDKMVENGTLHTAIAILKLYVTALGNKYTEAKKTVASYGGNCSCERDPQGHTKIQDTEDTLCWLFNSVHKVISYNSTYGISLDSENVDDINIKSTFKMIEKFSKCVHKKTENKWDDCTKHVFKQCGRKKGSRGKSRRRERTREGSEKKQRRNKGNKKRRNKKKDSQH